MSDRTEQKTEKGFTMSTLPSPMSTPASSRPPSPMTRPSHLPNNALSGLQGISSLTEDTKIDSTPTVKLRRGSSVGSRSGSAPGSRRGSSANLPKMEALSLSGAATPAPQREPGSFDKVACVGSGSWATALARIAAMNTAEKEGFDKEVRMWVREKEVEGGGKLTEQMNKEHTNARYLPGVSLPENLVAVPELADVVKDATLIIFCVPHQFLPPVLAELSKPGVLHPKARAISAIKGIEVHGPDIFTYPWLIEEKLGLPCSALGGANIALEVANSQFCETTIGTPAQQDAAAWHAVFDTPMFRVHAIEDVSGVSLSGALKNIVAMAAGFVDGLGMGGNTKAAILRIGLLEMSSFTLEFFPDASPSTFSHHSAGVADLITTSFGGRNRKCAEAFVKSGKTFPELEEELLDGQKLQGTITSEEIYQFLEARGRLDGYPLFEKVYKISFQGLEPESLFEGL
ncbi:glycerol-3-phosphate dehydrogenase (nad) [Phaffia rhodozyma]|uniref:Glycerol-3-phosphate dehydrogenase [NAD(+)] n=1 Tax=Phaffia rhodozyma TaxID=264483 RepID=A0A0F7SKH5_PHARH|nr:glycerol-3-phosphate dehydrogenase (nad) [Phaffia rhodozyma]